MHGGRELVREENAAEMEHVKGTANGDFEQRHSMAQEAGTKARRSVVRGDRSGREKAEIGHEKNHAGRKGNDKNSGRLDERRQ